MINPALSALLIEMIAKTIPAVAGQSESPRETRLAIARTLLINVLGSGIIGLVAAQTLTPARVSMHPDLRVFLMVGICGGFTTFSAFSLQTLELLQSGDIWPAGGYIAGSLVLCLAAVWAGWLVGRL